MENAAQLSAATVGFEHEDTQDHKDDDGMDVRGGEGCLQASAHGKPPPWESKYSMLHPDRYGFQNSLQFRSSSGMASMCTHRRLAGLQL